MLIPKLFLFVLMALGNIFPGMAIAAVVSTCGNKINNHTKVYCDNSTLSTVTYISFMEGNSLILPTIQNELYEVKHADDSPYQGVELPWPFNFFGENIYRVYVDPNGALHHNATQPSCSCFNINFNSTTPSYKGIIAGFMIDLFPNGNPNSNITYGYTSNSMVVSYVRVPTFANLSSLNTFHISLFNNGQISITYDNVMSYPQRQYWMSGIRSRYSVSDIRSGHYQNHTRPPATVFTASQLITGVTQWRTDVAGIYPPTRVAVDNQNQFTACPISTIWCAQPSFVNVTQTLPHTLVSFTPLTISCLDKVEFAVSLSTMPNNPPQSGACSSDLINMRITCDIVSIAAGVTGPVTVSLWWRNIGSSNPFVALSAVPVIPLTLYTNKPPTIPPGQSCSLNSPTAGTCNSTPCQVCQRQLGCLNQKCDSPTDPVLYDYPNYQCQNTCSNHTLFDEINNVCCLASNTDCNGECLGYGNAQIAYSSYATKTLVCCIDGKTVDCLGVCGGSAVYDGCGVCGGTNTDGHGCNTGINITTSSHSGKAIYTTFDLSSKRLAVPAYINISNTNSTGINVTLSYKFPFSGHLYAPRLIPPFSTKMFSIGPHSHSIVHFNVSLASLYSGNQTRWVVQIINLFVTRQVPGTPFARQLNRQVSIYPSTVGCTSVSNAHTCSRMPACIFCFEYNDIRVLQELDTSSQTSQYLDKLTAQLTQSDSTSSWVPASEVSDALLQGADQHSVTTQMEDALTRELMLDLISNIQKDSNSGTVDEEELTAKKIALYNYQRQLFPLIIPNAAGYNNFDDTVGVCAQGWLPDSCSAKNKYFSGPGSKSSSNSSANVSVTGNKFFVLLFAGVSVLVVILLYKRN